MGRFSGPAATLAGLLVLTASCAPSSNTALQPLVPAADVALEPGDAIRLSFTRERNLDGTFPVDENGRVALPILGARDVTGSGEAELKLALQGELDGRIRNQSVTIQMLRRIRVLGEVRNPGLFHVDPTMNLADAIALAGGAAGNGKLTDIRLVRGGADVGLSLNLNDPLPVVLASGDQIVVPARSWFSRNGVVVVGALISALGFIASQAWF